MRFGFLMPTPMERLANRHMMISLFGGVEDEYGQYINNLKLTIIS